MKIKCSAASLGATAQKAPPPIVPPLQATMRECVYRTDIHSTEELKQRLIHFWCNPDQDVINIAIEQWYKKCEAYVHVKEHTICTLTVTVYNFLCVTGLLNYSIFSGKSIKEMLTFSAQFSVRQGGNVVKVRWQILLQVCALIM